MIDAGKQHLRELVSEQFLSKIRLYSAFPSVYARRNGTKDKSIYRHYKK